MAGQDSVTIAVIGIGCRFPGDARDPERFWHMLAEGRDAWSDVPENRFKWKSFYNTNPESSGCMNHRGGHFVQQDLTTFDADFFGIHPTEAKSIDPQQRLLLEVTYEAIEDADLSAEKLKDSETSVYGQFSACFKIREPGL